MRKTTINKREKSLFQITIAIIAATLLYNMVIAPQRQRRTQTKQQRQELELNLQKLQADFQVKDQIEALHSRLTPMLRGGQSDQQEISRFTRQLHELYGPLKLTIKSVKILPLTLGSYTRQLLIKIEMKGQVKQMVEFITRLSDRPEPVKIEQFQLQATDVAEVVHATFLISKVVGPKG